MKKILSTLFIAIIIFGIFVPANFASAQTDADMFQFASNGGASVALDVIDIGTRPFVFAIGYALMHISALLLSIVGFFFDTVMKYTIVDMASMMNDPDGLGGSVSAAWAIIRDISNLVFIFVLLYAAFNAMFSLNMSGFGSTVKNIIIIALLINFSLFFTKVVIDASNVVSVGFYNAITSANEATLDIDQHKLNGISAGYMNLLGLSGIMDAGVLSIGMTSINILSIGVMASIFMTIAALIFFTIAIMFVSRFIVLIFLMILSPAALIAYIIPGAKGQFDKWKTSLINQALFAPVFFALTWVTFKIASAPKFLGNFIGDKANPFYEVVSAPSGVSGIVLNYVIVIGFSMASLSIAKSIASKSAYFSNINSSLGGLAGRAAFGGAAATLRNTAGRYGASVMNDRDLLERAARGDIGARMKLATANWASSSSFDARNLDGTLKSVGAGDMLSNFGKAGGKVGFTKIVDDKAKQTADRAKKLFGEKPGDKEIDKARKESVEKEVATTKKEEVDRIKQDRKAAAAEAKKETAIKNKAVKEHEAIVLASEMKVLKDLKEERSKTQKKLTEARKTDNKDEINKLIAESENYTKSIDIAKEDLEEKRKNMMENDEKYIGLVEERDDAKKDHDEKKKSANAKVSESDYTQEIQDKIKKLKEGYKSSSQERQEKYAEYLTTNIFRWRKVNQVAADKIKKQAKEKSKEQKFADLAKEIQKDEEKANKTDEPATDTTAAPKDNTPKP